MILNIVSKVANEFKIYRPNIGFYFGRRVDSEVKEEDRIVWYPTYDTFTPTWNIGNNGNELFSREVTLEFHVFSRDLNKIDDYINWLIVSIYDSVHAPQIVSMTGQHLDLGQEYQQGFGYILSVGISGIVIHRPLGVAEIEETEAHTHFDGSAEWVPDPP